MKVKKTQLLTAELRMIADTLSSKYSADILREAAERLVVKKPKAGEGSC